MSDMHYVTSLGFVFLFGLLVLVAGVYYLLSGFISSSDSIKASIKDCWLFKRKNRNTNDY